MSDLQKAKDAVDQALAALALARATLDEIGRVELKSECSHPLIARNDLTTFGGSNSFLCSICEEVVSE